MAASEQRCFNLERRLREMHMDSLEEHNLIREKNTLLATFDRELNEYKNKLTIKDTVLKKIVERYKKDTGLLNRELRMYHKGTPQRDEHIGAVEELMKKDRTIEELQTRVTKLETPVPPKRVSPTPDIEITDTGDVRVNLSSVRISKPAETKKEPKHSFFARAVKKVSKFFEI